MSNASFLDTQRRFAAHLRDPDAAPAPTGIEDRRMAIYRDLFWRNIEGFISNGFPVLRSLLSDPDWQALVRAFYASHRCGSGYFADIPAEFLQWLNSGDYPRDRYPPFIAELAYYEWLEMAVGISTEEIPEQGIDQHGDLLRGQLVLSPLCALTGSHWPVHQIAADAVPTAPLDSPVWLLVWRDRADKVHFMQLNAASARLIQLLEQDEAATADSLIATLAGELGQQPAALQPFLADILQQWRERDIILGIRA